MLNIPFFTMQTIFILSSASPLLVTARLHRTCVCHHRRPVIFRSIECTKHLSDVDSRRKRKIHQFLRAKRQNRNATMTDQIYSCRQRRWCLSPFFFLFYFHFIFLLIHARFTLRVSASMCAQRCWNQQVFGFTALARNIESNLIFSSYFISLLLCLFL